MTDFPTILVISGHAADFVWRCGGAIAKYAGRGSRVHIVCLTFGERGESGGTWNRKPGISEDEVKAIRKAEALKAAEVLGAEISFFDWGDHPLQYSREEIVALTALMRDVRPNIVLTHSSTDFMNPDHEAVFELTRWAVRAATVSGVLPESGAIAVPHIYSFEPDQASLENFKPDVYIDISDVIEKKKAAMDAIATQVGYMGPRYVDRARFRASLLNMMEEAEYAEAYVQYFAYEGDGFPR